MEKAQVIFWNTTINKIANILCFKHKKKGMCQNVDNAVFWFVGARFSFYTLPCCKKDLDVFQKDEGVS